MTGIWAEQIGKTTKDYATKSFPVATVIHTETDESERTYIGHYHLFRSQRTAALSC